MSCCTNYQCGTLPDFKIRCIDGCNGTASSNDDKKEINYIDMIYTADAVLGAVPSVQYRIQNEVYTTVIFNNIIEQYGTAVSPNLATGVFTVNESGIYNISYSIAWNNISYTSTGSASANNTGLKFAAIVVDTPLTDTTQAYAVQTNAETVFTSNFCLSQNGMSDILLNEGDVFYVLVMNVTNYTNLLSQVSGIGVSPVVGVTSIKINKVE
jgi:hypothetical protein